MVVLCIRENPNQGLQRKRKRFGRGSLDAILSSSTVWLFPCEEEETLLSLTRLPWGGMLGRSPLLAVFLSRARSALVYFEFDLPPLGADLPPYILREVRYKAV